MRTAIVLLALLTLGGCATAKPIQTPGGAAGYMIDCSSTRHWTACFEKATETCGGPYEIINQAESGWGRSRTLLIQCK